MEERERFGLRDDDELIGVILVLLLVALLAFYFIRGFARQDGTLSADATPIAVVENVDEATDANPDTGTTDVADPNAGVVDADTGATSVVGSGTADNGGASAESDTTSPPAVAQSAPSLELPGERFQFGSVQFSGKGDANTDVAIEVDGAAIGETRVSRDGVWSYTSAVGAIGSGAHSVIARSGEFTSEAVTFSIDAPAAPTLKSNYNGAVAEPGKYAVNGTGIPNWQVGVRVAENTIATVPTDANGDWTAQIEFGEPGIYELEVLAIDADGTPIESSSTGVNRIAVTADGQIPEGFTPAGADSGLAADGAGTDTGDSTADGSGEGSAGTDDAGAEGDTAADGSDDGGAAEDNSADASTGEEGTDGSGDGATSDDGSADAEASADGDSAEGDTAADDSGDDTATEDGSADVGTDGDSAEGDAAADGSGEDAATEDGSADAGTDGDSAEGDAADGSGDGAATDDGSTDADAGAEGTDGDSADGDTADDGSVDAGAGDEGADGDSTTDGSGDGAATDDGSADTTGNLIASLQSTGQHNTLLAALDATGLTATVQDSADPLTILAPTDGAFAGLPPGALDALLANPEALQAVLTEHVVPGSAAAADVVGIAGSETPRVTNLAGNQLSVLVENETVTIGGANVTQADIPASNGVIHAIDRVLLPPNPAGTKPVIDVRGVPIFKGTDLTVVGTAQPGTTLILTLNGEEFGRMPVTAEGTFEIPGQVTDGEYEILAWSVDENGLPLSVSTPVYLIVDNS